MRPILEMRDIAKSFPGVNALDKVSLTVMPAEIHAIVGENGAGKSTLMKILSGVYPFGSYSGQILYEGEERAYHTISESEQDGIIIIHQELALVPLLSIAENIFLGHEPAAFGKIDWFEVFTRTRDLLKRVGLDEHPNTLVTNLGTGKQQLVEIAKALNKRVKLLILDEPTASLNDKDSETLLALLQEFRANGIASILITHKLNEVVKVADRITVLRDGTTVDALDCRTEQISENRIIKAMVGRELHDRYPKRSCPIGETIFSVKDWSVYHPLHADRRIVKSVSLNVRAGEVVGIAGLMGAGRTEFAMSVFGRSYGEKITGDVFVHGQKVDTSTVNKAMKAGLAYATEDRKTFGLVLNEDIKRNITLAYLEGVSKYIIIDDQQELKIANSYRSELAIRSASVFQSTGHLSGGNQQKVVLSKWLFSGPDILILDEPTRGIDVGAKYEIYGIINRLAEQGKAVILISSEMPELLGMSDRIYVMNEGRFVDEVVAAQATQETIMQAIMKSWEN